MTVAPRADGTYLIYGSFAFVPDKAPDFDAYGVLGKDGLIHFLGWIALGIAFNNEIRNADVALEIELL